MLHPYVCKRHAVEICHFLEYDSFLHAHRGKRNHKNSFTLQMRIYAHFTSTAVCSIN